MLLILLFLGCERDSQPYVAEKEPFIRTSFSFAIHPYKNTQATFDAYKPILEYIESKVVGVSLDLETSNNYAHFEQKLKEQSVDFALPNPYQTVEALDLNYTVVAKMAPDDVFRGVIVARKDANIQNLSDLKGKKVSFPAPTALAATLMPKWFMYERGVDPNRDFESIYVGSQDSSILNAYMSITVAGCTWPPPWELWAKNNPEKASKMSVIWQTDSLPNNSVMAHSRVPKEIQSAIAKALIDMKNDKTGLELLKKAGFDGFEEAEASTYKKVEEFLEKYDKALKLPSMADGR